MIIFTEFTHFSDSQFALGGNYIHIVEIILAYSDFPNSITLHSIEQQVNGYTIKMNKIFRKSNPTMFGINLSFERKIARYIIKYHLMCGTLASMASISFLIGKTMSFSFG